MTIRYIPYEDIDLKKWDAAIDSASNGSVYVYSTYLNHLSPGWDALVKGDYEAVMPLTSKKKWGVHYLIQPYLSAEGGVFQKEPIDATTLSAFLETIPGKFKFWEFSLNSGNPLQAQGFTLTKRTNFILDLHRPYEEIYKEYRKDLKTNLKKATEAGLRYAKDEPIETVIQLANQKLAPITRLEPIHYERFANLVRSLKGVKAPERLKVLTRSIQTPAGATLTSAVFLFSHKKAYYVLAGNHPDGRSQGASHMLIDQFIREFAGQDLTFDFEGSDIPSLALFYKAYGAEEAPYPAIKLNRLSAPLRWLKR